ncbi:MAG: D-sedoheptulose 7-phosphate isomerase, partial [Bacteroidia bacterium]
EAAKHLQDFAASEKSMNKIEEAAGLIADAFQKNKKVISCGNGGSMCDAMHFAEELSGKFRDDRKPLAALSISDPSHITCTANDFGFGKIFSRYIEAVGAEGDVLLAISTGGNSENVLRAAESAREKKMKVIALTGKDGGKLSGLCDIEIRAPHSAYADRIQEIHIKIIHSLIHAVELKLDL